MTRFGTGRAQTIALAFFVALVPCADASLSERVLASEAPLLAYSGDRQKGSESEIYIVRADGTDRRRLTVDRLRNTLPLEGVGSTWSPDGRRLIYVEYNSRGNATYFIYDLSTRRRARLASRIAHYLWSPDGSRIAFQRKGSMALRSGLGGGDGVLTVFDVESRRKTVVHRDFVNDAGDFDWSPDGQRLAFHTLSGGLFVVKHDGTGRRRLLRGAESPEWSPDGRWIAFLRPLRGCCLATVHTVRPDGSGLRQLLPVSVESWGDRMQWAPDGQRLAVSQSVQGGAHRLGIVDPDTRSLRWIHRSAAADVQWSRDGQRVAFWCSERPCIAAVAGGRLWRIVSDVGYGWSASPELDAVALDGEGGVHIFRREANAPVRITPAMPSCCSSWSPDGRWISFNGTNGLYVVRPDGSELRRLAKVFNGHWQPQG